MANDPYICGFMEENYPSIYYGNGDYKGEIRLNVRIYVPGNETDFSLFSFDLTFGSPNSGSYRKLSRIADSDYLETGPITFPFYPTKIKVAEDTNTVVDNYNVLCPTSFELMVGIAEVDQRTFCLIDESCLVCLEDETGEVFHTTTDGDIKHYKFVDKNSLYSDVVYNGNSRALFSLDSITHYPCCKSGTNRFGIYPSLHNDSWKVFRASSVKKSPDSKTDYNVTSLPYQASDIADYTLYFVGDGEVSAEEIYDVTTGLRSNYTDDLKISLCSHGTARIYAPSKINLAVENLVVNDKVYDGSLEATVEQTYNVVGVANNEDQVNVGCTARLLTKDVGENKRVMVEYTLSGSDSDKYVAPLPSEAYITVSPKSLIVTGTDIRTEKGYDEKTVAEVINQGVFSTPLISGDHVGLRVNADYNNATSGSNKSIVVKFDLTDQDAGNYVISSVSAYRGTNNANNYSGTISWNGEAKTLTYSGCKINDVTATVSWVAVSYND